MSTRLIILILLLFMLNITPITSTDAQTDREILRLGRGTANALDWHPDGEILAVGSSTGLWLLDINLDILSYETMLDSIDTLAWSPDGTQLAMVGRVDYECQLQIWDVSLNEQTFELDVCSDDLKWNRDGTRLAVIERNPLRPSLIDHEHIQGRVWLINAIDSVVVAELIGYMAIWFYDGESLLTATYYSEQADTEQNLYIWKSETGEYLLHIENLDSIPYFLWATAENTFATLCNEITDDDQIITYVCEYDLSTGEQTELFQVASSYQRQDFTLDNFRFDAEQNRLVYTCCGNIRGFLGSLYMLDVEANLNIYLGDAENYILSSDRTFVTVIVGNGYIRNIDITIGDTLNEAMLFTAPINGLDWQPDSTQIATVGFGYDQYVRVWDSAVDALDPQLIWETEVSEFVDYTSGGDVLVTGGTIGTDIVINQNIFSWDANTGERLEFIYGYYEQGGSLPFRAWNADYTRYAYIEDNVIRMSDDPDVAIPAPELFLHAFLSPDETMLAVTSRLETNSAGYRIDIWELISGEIIITYISKVLYLWDLYWSPDSTMLTVSTSRPTSSGWYYKILRGYIVDSNQSYDDSMSELELDDQYSLLQSGVFYPLNMGWSNDNTMIAVTFNDSVAVFEFGNQDPLLTIPIPDMAQVVWSSDDSQIAFGGFDGVVYVVDVNDLSR